MKAKITPIPPDLDKAFETDVGLKQALARRQDLGIGRSLRYAREELGITQQAVADAMGVEQSRVSQIEGAEGHRLSLGVLARYAEAIGTYVRLDLMNAATRQHLSQILISTDGARTIDQVANDGEMLKMAFRSVPVVEDWTLVSNFHAVEQEDYARAA